MDKTGLLVYDNNITMQMTKIDIQGGKYNILGLTECTNCFQIEKEVGKGHLGEKNYFEVFTFEVKHFLYARFLHVFFFADDSNPKKDMQKAYQQKVDLSWFVRAFTYILPFFTCSEWNHYHKLNNPYP